MLTKSQLMIWEKGTDVWERLRDKHIFVTGGTGFFGKSMLELVSAFNINKNLNLRLTILTRNREIFLKSWGKLFAQEFLTFVDGDILTFSFKHEAYYDHILHFATPASTVLNVSDPIKMFDVIVGGTRQVLEFAKYSQVKSVLLASSGAVYGKQPVDLLNVSEAYLGAPSVELRSSTYGEAKRVAELLGNIYSELHAFDYKIARCFALVGPHLDPNEGFAIGNFIRDALRGDIIEVNGDGTPYRSYLYSEDLVLWLFKILLDGDSRRPYNVGSDKSISIKDLAETIVKLVNPKAKINVSRVPVIGRQADRYVPSIELARKELQLDVFTSIDEAIQQTADVYRKRMAL